MLQLTDAGKRFGPRLLFQNANWLITSADRTALVGANGTGKSTILKVLAGLETLDYGTMQRTKGMTVGYLPQEGLVMTGRTVLEECMAVFANIREMERELETLAEAMGETDPASAEYEQITERFSSIDNRLRAMDGYSLEAQVATVLNGLGFGKEDWHRGTHEFSGGWQMRIALGKLLLEKPDLLLLDEPTNHLDLETRNWLESYLLSYPKAYILISHDRYFLDVTAKKIIEIWNSGLHSYTGNYEKYLTQKNDRRLQLEAAYKNQRERVEHLEAFISRFRAQATKAKQVQSRIKELEKIERITLPPEETEIHFNFPQPKPSGRSVLEAQNVSQAYGEKLVFSGASFTIERGDRIALVGPNGAGKSTLIRLLAGIEPPAEGTVRIGHNVLIDYFAQDQYKSLDAEARMLDDLGAAAPKVTQTELRTLLGCFLFSDDDVFKPIGVLSGGERNRYALARLLLSSSNFLLLDEPTNHLDLRAKDVLLEALRSFTGTVVFVSHDRYFLDAVATRIFEVQNGQISVYPGNYEDYLWRKSGGAERLAEESAAGLGSAKNGSAPVAVAATNNEPREKVKRVNPIRAKQMRERLKAVEIEVAQAEMEITAAETALSAFASAEETQRLTQQLAATRQQHTALLTEWETLSTELDEVPASN